MVRNATTFLFLILIIGSYGLNYAVHHAGHGGHRGHARYGHHFGRHRHYHHPYHHSFYRHHGYWNAGWGWGYPGWTYGATAALIAGVFYYAGYTYPQWLKMAEQDPEKRHVFETEVQPAYIQYQQNPSLIPSYDIQADQDMQSLETTIDYQNDYPTIGRCCTDRDSSWYQAGPDRDWRVENISMENFSIYRRSDYHPISFTDLSEQPAISGFERSIYTSPK